MTGRTGRKGDLEGYSPKEGEEGRGNERGIRDQKGVEGCGEGMKSPLWVMLGREEGVSKEG